MTNDFSDPFSSSELFSPTKSITSRLVLDIHLTSNSDLAQLDRHQAVQYTVPGVRGLTPNFFARDSARIWQKSMNYRKPRIVV